jgi:putative ABC transport system substrate-binding protein
MNRREVIALVGGGVAAWPVAARAQRTGKTPTIGFLGTASASAWSRWVPAFTQRLRELGWIEGHTIAIEYRWAEGREESYTETLAEFIRLKVDVMVVGGAALPVAKRAASVIPIVFTLAGDPVRSGAVASLARPGGNITGLSSQSTDLAGKRLQLLREVIPSLRRFAILANMDYPSAVLEVDEIHLAAQTLGLEARAVAIRSAQEIPVVFETLASRTDALYVPADPLVNSNRIRINTLALGARLPTMFGFREYVEAGGLMSYGPTIPDLFRRAAEYVDKILRGASPADLPVEQPTKFDLVINLITAKALGLEVPPMLLARADEVIE